MALKWRLITRHTLAVAGPVCSHYPGFCFLIILYTVYVEMPRVKKENSSKTHSGLFACIKIRVKWVACVPGMGGAGGWNTLRQSKWFVDLKRLKHTQAGPHDGFQLTCHI